MNELLNRLFKTQKEKRLFFMTVAVVLFYIIFNMGIWPLWEQWNLTATKLNQKKAELTKIKALIKDEKTIRADFDQYQKAIRLKDPNARPEDTMLLQAEEMQKEANTLYTRMDPVLRKKISKTNYQAYSLQVAFDSDLRTVGDFLQSVQEHGLYIDYLAISTKAKAAKNPTLQTSLRMGKVIEKKEDVTAK